MHRLRLCARRPLLAALLSLLGACAGGEPPRAEEGSAPPAAGPAAAGPAAAVISPSGEIDLSSLGYSRGSPDAPVSVVEFSDFGCPYCAKFALESLPELSREFVESGRVRWRYIPFELGIFPNGGVAALAAECAGEQGRFWEMHDLLYERQREWKPSDAPEALFRGYARSLGLNLAGFASCYREERTAPRIELHNEVARRLGVRATPSFLVNGRPVEGALPLEQFRTLIEWSAANPSNP